MTNTEQPDFLHWNPTEGCYELYCDHYMLSALRKCEAYFVESVLNRIVRGRAWSLDFGIFVHSCVEYMYSPPTKRILTWKQQFNSTQVTIDTTHPYCSAPELVDYGAVLWQKMKFMEFHNGHRQFKAFGGFSGVTKLLLNYWQCYGESREPLKIIATECPFGREKEVYLGEIRINGITVKCYYSGRIDIIVDDGISLGVMDTKTTNRFDGDEITSFLPHEGMMGYVFALREIITKFFPDQQVKPCNRLIINHIQVSDARQWRDRFKRTPLTFTFDQLEEWRIRQLSTFKRVFELVQEQRVPDWNTEICSRFYYASDCPYKELHRQSPKEREIIKKAQYIQLEKWSPYKDGQFEEVKHG